MRFLANENFPLASINCLRAEGHDVRSVSEDSPGARDSDVLARSQSEGRIILTFDRDYGDLVYGLGLPSPSGVVFFRFDPLSPIEPGEHLLQLLAVGVISLENRFTVVERGRVRQRPLP
jgi:predicted nuclease of predicted toxin-antitoxin system